MKIEGFGLHGHHNHVPQADATRWLPGVISTINVGWVNGESPLSPKAPVYLRAGQTTLHPVPTSNTFQGTIQWVDTTHYLWVILDTRLNWSPHIHWVRKRNAQMMVVLSPPEQEKWTLHLEWIPALQVAHPPHDRICVTRIEFHCMHCRLDTACVALQLSSRAMNDSWNVSGSRFMRICVFRYLSRTSEPCVRTLTRS